MKFLVGVDNREGGRDALELARTLAGAAGESVEVLTCEDGSAAAALTTRAEQDDFDAIVVGSSHRGPLGRVLVGSTAMSLLDGAPVDVAVAPKGYAAAGHPALRRIAVAYNGTPESKQALRLAEAVAKAAGAAIEIITVVQLPVATPVPVPGPAEPQIPPRPEKVMSEGLASVDPAVTAESVRCDGDPASEIVRACEKGVDLLVVGSRGHGPVQRVLLGSVSRQLVHKASCPVLVARRP